MKSNWNYPTTVWVGENRVSDLSEACKNLNIKKPLFVTDKDLVNLSFVKKIISLNSKKFSEFTDLSSCALKKIQKECSNNTNCRNENTRFVDVMKRLQTMVEKNEISDNEAMFRYYNLIDSEESRFNARKNLYFSPYQHYSNDFYLRGVPACYFSRTSFCY